MQEFEKVERSKRASRYNGIKVQKSGRTATITISMFKEMGEPKHIEAHLSRRNDNVIALQPVDEKTIDSYSVYEYNNSNIHGFCAFKLVQDRPNLRGHRLLFVEERDGLYLLEREEDDNSTEKAAEENGQSTDESEE